MTAVATPHTAVGAKFGTYSEVGTLRKVMVHKPDLELKRLTPDNHDELLFDDVLWVKRATEQHEAFDELLKSRGIEVFLEEDLLGQALEDPRGPQVGARPRRDRGHRRSGHVRRDPRLSRRGRCDHARRPPDRRPDRARGTQHRPQPPPRGGHRHHRQAARWSYRRWRTTTSSCGRCRTATSRAIHLRGSTTASSSTPCTGRHVGSRRSTSRRSTASHPMFKNADFEFWYSRDQEGEDFGTVSSEGGDIMPIGNRTVAIGMSERTTGQMIEKIALSMFAEGCCRSRHRRGHDQGPRAHASRHRLHARRSRRCHGVPQGRRQHRRLLASTCRQGWRAGGHQGEILRQRDRGRARCQGIANCRNRWRRGAAGARAMG